MRSAMASHVDAVPPATRKLDSTHFLLVSYTAQLLFLWLSFFCVCCWCVFLFLISLRARTLFLCLFFPHPPHWWKVWIGRLMSSSWHPAAARTCATVYLFFFRRCARRLIQHTIHQLLPLFPRRSSCFPSKVWLILVSVGDELGKKETERNRNHKRMLVRITAALNFRLFLIFFYRVYCSHCLERDCECWTLLPGFFAASSKLTSWLTCCVSV